MNIPKSLLAIYFCIISFGMTAQELHTPQEVEQYMKKSTIQYQIDSLSVELESVFLPLIEKGNFLEKTEKGLHIKQQEFLLHKKSKRFYKKAVAKEKYEKAIKYYTKAIEAQPDQLRLMNEFANFYWENGDWENVVFWAAKGV